MISSSKRLPRKVRVHVGNSTFAPLWSANQAWTEPVCSRLGPALGCGGGWGLLGCSVPSTSPTEQGGVALRGGAGIFTRYSGRGDELRIQGWMLRKDFSKNRTIWASTSLGEKTALAKSLGMKVSAF